jgi:hypothetical protein
MASTTLRMTYGERYAQDGTRGVIVPRGGPLREISRQRKSNVRPIIALGAPGNRATCAR